MIQQGDRHGEEQAAEHLCIILTSDHSMVTMKKKPTINKILLFTHIRLKDFIKSDIVDYGGFEMLLPKAGWEEPFTGH
jgi:hypothetical protein